MRLKVEINSREHLAVHGFKRMSFSVASRWFQGQCEIATYERDELLGTKLRALYPLRKGRDLFDLATALQQDGVDPERIVTAFMTYMIMVVMPSHARCLKRTCSRSLGTLYLRPTSDRCSPTGMHGIWKKRPTQSVRP
jgi:hypothetical protein